MKPSDLIDKQIASFPDWRGKIMIHLRKLIHETDPNIAEEWKWDVGVYTDKGMVCAVSAFKDHVKINFFQGAQLSDPKKIFNSGLDSKRNRGIDFFENDKIDENAVKEIIKSAVDHNKKK